MFTYKHVMVFMLSILMLTVVGCADDAGNAPANSETPAVSAAAPAGTDAPSLAPAMPDIIETAPMDPCAVAATVNNHDIKVGTVENVFQNIMQERARGKEIQPAMMNQMRQMYQEQIVQMLVDQYLLEEQIKKEGLTITDEELAAQAKTRAGDIVDRDLQQTLERTGMSREDLEKMLQEKEPQATLDGKVAEMKTSVEQDLVKNPNFRMSLLQDQLLNKKFADVLTVTDEAEQQYYKENVDQFSQPETVRASHILVKIEEGADETAKAAAQTKAKEILTKVQAEGSDFAALAKENSDCPSKNKGGDLGFFPREGAMVEPFAKAAFDMKVGDTSDLVETQFGYHIIKVTERKPAAVKSFDEVKTEITETLTNTKKREVMTRYRDELHSAATISYGEGYAPQEAEPQPNTVAVPPAGEAAAETPADQPEEEKP